MIKEYNNQRKK